jgi:uncharacterized membrane protein
MKKTLPSPSPQSLHWLDAHHRIFFACLLAVVALFASYPLGLPMRLLVTWDVFALTSVVLGGYVLLTRDPYEVRRNARMQDSSATFLFSAIIFAAVASLLTVGLLMETSKSLPPGKLAVHVALSLAAVIFSWALVHILFALRYAHLYYANAREKDRDKVSGGLAFPEEKSPNYTDFAYFSFIIGMTCQVSDVQVTGRNLRALALAHGLISFCFNTAILAIFVNIIAGLI